MKIQTSLIAVLSLIGFTACGRQTDESPIGQYNHFESFEAGKFRAILRPLNNQLNGWIPNGVADLSVSTTEFRIKSWLDDSANVEHRQFITMVSKCPSRKDDLNKDGFIDLKEAISSTKKIYLPLDSNLSIFSEVGPQFPKGNFSYEQSVPLNTLALPNEIGLKLSGKTIMVLGTNLSKDLPNSVSSLESVSPQLSIPIACGIIEKIL